jgi:hypothetical protein
MNSATNKTIPYANLADGASGVQVFDSTSPRAPFRVADYPTTAYDILTRGNRAYVTDNGLVILDITHPTKPTTLVLRTNTPGVGKALVLSRGYAFVADGTWGMAIVPLPVQTSPATLSSGRLANDAFRFDVLGTTNLNYVLQSFTNPISANAPMK